MVIDGDGIRRAERLSLFLTFMTDIFKLKLEQD